MRRLPYVLSSVVVALACWSGGASGATTKTASQILELTLSEMHAEGSFHYTSTSSIGGKLALTLSTDSSLTNGVQLQKLDGGTETIVLIGKKLYMKANAKAYAQDFAIKKTTLANKWVMVPATNKNYASIAEGILVTSVMHELEDVGTITYAGTVTIDGQSAFAVHASPGSGSEYIYVSAKAPYLPLGIAAQGTVGGKKIVNEVVFSKWGEKFRVKAPSHYVVATAKTFP